MSEAARFQAFLKEAIGLDTASIGSGAIARAIRERIEACELSDEDAYWLLLSSSEAERRQLIEAVVVPETWFFRDPGAFNALVDLARVTRAPTLRVLSAPCSTGEEPYSIAMALLDAGLPASRFSIDAIDISSRALDAAKSGRYRNNSFRSRDLDFRKRHFDRDQIRDNVKERVRFHLANLFDAPTVLGSDRYQVIFCRNLLIYFDRPTQDRAVAVLRSMLAEDGVLFVGPSETGLFLSHGFEAAKWPMAFGFRLPSPRATRAPPAPTREARQQGETGVGERRVPPISVAIARVTANAPKKPLIDRADRRAFAPFTEQRPSDLGKPALPEQVAAARSPLLALAPNANTVVGEANTPSLKEIEALADRGEIAAARECCEAVIRASGPSAQALYLLGLLQDVAGEKQSAIASYRGAIYLNPQHHEALTYLALLMEDAGDQATAARLRDRAKRALAAKANDSGHHTSKRTLA